MASIIEFQGQGKGDRNCGYCKQTSNDDFTFGMWAHQLTAQEYQSLIDRNWRRSGKYCYKPMNDKICCPMYTIRCDAENFKLRKSHKKVIKNFNNFIKYGTKPTRASKTKDDNQTVDMDDCKEQRTKAQQSASNFDENAQFKHFQEGTSSKQALTTSLLNMKSDQLKSTNTVKEKDACTLGERKNVNNPNKKKYKRRQKLISKIIKRQSCSEEEAKQILFERSAQKQKTKTLEDFFSESSNCPEVKHIFKKKFIPLSTKAAPNAFELSYNVFRKYQMNIHNEPERKVSYRGFTQFLVDSPIKYQSVGAPINSSDDLVRFYGSFHQHYYIDDRLIAVAVLDILPNCISSVYLYYDPEFSFLNLGVYSALTEIALVRKFKKFCPDLKYYYMGYYIDSCPKMKYKGQFSPSDLLCCETFRWVSLESCTVKLLAKRRPYARFCDDLLVEDSDGEVDDKAVMLLYEDTVIDLQSARLKYSLKSGTVKLIREYARLVGKSCASSLFYYLSKD